MGKILIALLFTVCLAHTPVGAACGTPAGEGTPNTAAKAADRSPELTGALDISGNPVTLRCLRGNYVYIDVWATWCGPCLAELPHLEKLRQEFDGRKIVFLSISSEAHKGKWAAMVREKNMGGVQVNTAGDKTFEKAYGIEGIPRFILLDRRGRIIDPDMTRPSDPQTAAALKLLKRL